MKKTYIKPEFDNIVLDGEILQTITVSGNVDEKDPIGSGTDNPPSEGDVNKSSLWDEEEDYL